MVAVAAIALVVAAAMAAAVAVRVVAAMAVAIVLAAVATAAVVVVVVVEAVIKPCTPGQRQRCCLTPLVLALGQARHKRLRNFGFEAFLP